MVMSKVSKAIVASFLCFTINVGYNFTNAMDSGTFENGCNDFDRDSKVNYNNCNDFNFDPDNDPVYKDRKNEFVNGKYKSKQSEDSKDKDSKDKNDQNKNIWRVLIASICVVVGAAVGLLLSKFVF